MTGRLLSSWIEDGLFLQIKEENPADAEVVLTEEYNYLTFDAKFLEEAPFESVVNTFVHELIHHYLIEDHEKKVSVKYDNADLVGFVEFWMDGEFFDIDEGKKVPMAERWGNDDV